ncbi:unnamed protein product [Timema podura]|uniref:MULE transposase domain-containing protein n=1 Tax=Timema podura TaxID=61482 RepID=A0ABN7PDU0_TIMPD|nr:unnamed protein product [Timema podura]
MTDDGKNINVTYYKTHCGHISTFGRVMLAKEDRIRIAGLIESGITLQHILDLICVSATEENFQRIHMITKKDLQNICKEFSLHTEKQYSKDATDVDEWVASMNSLSKEDNPVIFYKPQNTSDINNILSQEDFCLVIMTSFQKNILEKFGNYKICVDTTHSTNASDFALTTVMTVDEFLSGFPVAFCISNRKDTLIWTLFFELLKDILGIQIMPEIFMSADDAALYEAWENIMGTAERQLLCTWDVDRNWQITVKSMISNKEKRVLVYQMLRSVLQETDKETFEKLMKVFMEELEEDNDLNEFHWYFSEHYASRQQLWAQCYRTGTDINVNMYLDSLNKLIKYLNSDGQKNKRLDKCISILMKLIRDSISKRLIKLEKNAPKNKNKFKIIDSADCKGIIDETQIITTIKEGSSWKVESSTESITQYIVSKQHTTCDGSCKLRCSHCKVCIHMYNCTCINNIIKMNLCKHIHACMHYLCDTSTNVTIIELNPELRKQTIASYTKTPILNNMEDNLNRIRQKSEVVAGYLATCKLQEIDARSIEQGLDNLLHLIQNVEDTEKLTQQSKEPSYIKAKNQDRLYLKQHQRPDTNQKQLEPNTHMLKCLTIDLDDQETMVIHSGFDHSYL